MYIQVLIELKIERLDKTFTYHVPPILEPNIMIGKRVIVPFGKQKLEGFVLKIEHNIETDYPIKDIIEITDEIPVLNEELLELGVYLKKKTLCNLIQAYETMLPVALKAKQGRTIPKKIIIIAKLKMPYEQALMLTNNDPQRRIVELLGDQSIPRSELNKISVSAVKTLEQKHIIEYETKEEYRLSSKTEETVNRKELTAEQQTVLNSISLTKFQPYLLHGVTGSGKTEVYIRLIEQVLKERKEALLLVPEISLTPQVVDIFGARFGDKIAILHSGLSNGEKYDEWRKIEKKEVSIVIGARSAIFAPFTNLGIIIIDEEHSTTYKQDNTPRYNTIDVALWRAKKYQIPLILGSATPSIESYTRASMGTYQLLEMKDRVNNKLPNVELVDMKDEYRHGKRILSRVLETKIIDRINKKEQIILLLNRRGYSTILTCKACGFTHKCPNCDIPLTYHKYHNMMECHYCSYHVQRLMICPNCKEEQLSDSGMGTEKLEQYLIENIDNAKVLRMDNDTTSKKGSHAKIIESFEKGEYNILLGTQMIAKGLDFPNVTLVGVVNSDSTLNIPDFRSAERTFQLLNQVAGRAGRGEKAGEVIIQGFNVEHYSMVTAKNHDYLSFYKEEMSIRKKLNYSPYFNLVVLKLKGKDDQLLMDEGKKVVAHLRKTVNASILGPSFALVPKINNVYEVQIIIKCKKKNEIFKECLFFLEYYRKNNHLYFDIDFDPIRM